MSNPFFEPLPVSGIPQFQEITTAHFLEAFPRAFAEHAAEIDMIVRNPEPADFFNTIEALERAGGLLRRVDNVFWNLTSSLATDEMQALEREIVPRHTRHQSTVLTNSDLFARVNAIADMGDRLNEEQRQLLDTTRQSFLRAGAALDEAGRSRINSMTEQLASLYTTFSQNVLKDTGDYALVLHSASDLAGLPESVRRMGETEALSRGLVGKYVFTTSRSSMTPFLQYASDRRLREEIYRAYTSCGTRSTDNRSVIRQIVALRQERAKLLGYASHADFMLDDRMAGTPAAVRDLLDRIWAPCQRRVTEEAADLQALIEAEGQDFELAAWDWWYYTEKLRQSRFDIDEEAVKPYFRLENVRDGAFDVARRLYGLVFQPRPDLPVYHPDVQAYEVTEADGILIGYFLFDFYMRPTKRDGAWMSTFRNQSKLDGPVHPVIVNCCNFSSSEPCLLGLDEVETLFHEFGHGLHGLLSNVTYESLSGTEVKQDFVELPSQIMEHWAVEPEVLKSYARHVDSGEAIPDALITKLRSTATFNQGFATAEYLAACYLDLAWHAGDDALVDDVDGFEQRAMDAVGKVPMVDPRYKSTYFQHIFSDDHYSAGYYVYIWAGVLDTDGFDAFREQGLFDPETARSFRRNILEMGGSADPMTLYRRFRGRNRPWSRYSGTVGWLEPRLDAFRLGFCCCPGA